MALQECISTFNMNKDSIVAALKSGFLVLDTAKAYRNESLLGEAIQESKVKGVEIILKLPKDALQSDQTVSAALQDSLERTGVIPGFIVIEAPYPDVKLFQRLGSNILKHKLWGVRNFDEKHLTLLLDNGYKPFVNQVEYHPHFQQRGVLKICNKHGIILQAHNPLKGGKLLKEPVLVGLAEKYRVSPATIVYAWLYSTGIGIVAEVPTKEHLDQLKSAKKLRLIEEDMQAIYAMHMGDKGRTCVKGQFPFTEETEKNWTAK